MADYLDIGVVRIQSWLTRTPVLRGRRGASAMISRATEREEIEKALALVEGLAEINEVAGQVDGVVSLQLLTGSKDGIRQVEEAVASHLRQHLPAASLQATYWRGETYLDARTGDPVAERDWPAPVAEWPPGRPCQWCRTWPATEVVGVGDDGQETALCADCLLRNDPRNSGRNTSRRRIPRAERELRKRLGDETAPLPDEFQVLARQGPNDDNTHLATLHADGNAIGKFIRQVRGKQRKSPGTSLNVAQLLDEATWQALVSAVQSVHQGREKLPVIPHLVGGDDVLVSVPVHDGWRFAEELQHSFDQHLQRFSSELATTLPSLSVGLVIHHETTPFSTVVELAESLLGKAKQEHRGDRAALAWQDITNEGPTPTGRPSVPHSALRQQWEALRELAGLTPSTRSRLAQLQRAVRKGEGGATEARDEHVGRRGLHSAVGPFVSGNAMDLLDALGMVRWWSQS
ncbi:hypothetical protein FHX42_002639 [Saccharopolyspora lacisalsi]|uniref:Cas10/Cmr2 second palm domain-containing protein n=1 Tax=Halosaccharopolyspora lacisalsi TaxID=1000566 RepID=A0A839E2Z7_9PSEU|nr:hypothetical protein [Halosaccharopolyspora lacisalsi]MBA8825288.1 hypothetical protein [Halosaccharopolyspora lacisalsi]